MAGLGFKVADGYVEVHARYNKGEVQRAAQDAADDNDRAYNKERESNAKSGESRDTNRRIGRQANEDFVRGVREQTQRQKESPFISLDNVKRDSSALGRVHVQEFGKSADREVDKNRNTFRRIGRKIGEHMFGKDNAAHAATTFFKRFAEAITFGQADFSSPKVTGPLSKAAAAIGSTLGIALAASLIAEIGNLITAALPVVLGGALLALPIADLIFRNVTLQKGKLQFKNNDIGKTIEGFIRQAQHLTDALGKAFQGPFMAGLQAATTLMKGLEKPLVNALKAISPGAVALWKGFLGAISAFGVAMAPALPGINAGLGQWGKELPGLGTALGKMITTILRNPTAVKNAVHDLFETLKLLVGLAGHVVDFATRIDHLVHQIGLVFVAFRQIPKAFGVVKGAIAGFIGWLKGIGTGIWNSIKTATINAWNTVKGVVQRALAAVKGAISAGVAVIKRVWSALWNNQFSATVRNALGLVKAVWTLTLTAIKAVLTRAAANIKSTWSKLWNGVKSAASSAWNAIKSVITRALTAIVSFVSSRTGITRSKVVAAWNAIKSATSSAWNAVKAATTAAWGLIVNTIKSRVAAAIAVVRTIKSKVIGALAGAGGWLISAGRAIIQGLLNGINSMIGSVGSALGRLTAYIKSHKGPPEKDAVLLVESGRLIMKSLIKGFQAGEGEVKSYLGGLTGAMPAMAQGGASYQTTSSFSPTIHVHVQAGLDPVDAAARRALVKGLWLETEKFRKDYVR